MPIIILRVVYLFVCGGAIVSLYSPSTYGQTTELPPFVDDHPIITAILMILATQSVSIFDWLIGKKRIEVISAVYFGLLVGVLLAYVLVQAFDLVIPMASAFKSALVLATSLIIPYVCISLLLQTKDDFRFVIPYVEFARDLKSGRPLFVDSSALIDGRIYDVVETQIIASPMIVPDFILNEVQEVADSGDKGRRTRGRRGLEVLSKLQNSPHTEVRVQDTHKEDFQNMNVDQRICALAKQAGGAVITNDFNLNKVASVQGIPVINLNDVANALKPRFIPGERLTIRVNKTGEAPGQGVGFLDDGTMVVCEQAAHMVGKDIDVIVTSVLQASAGRMIFGKRAQGDEDQD